MAGTPFLEEFTSRDETRWLIERAFAEDLGPDQRDVTGELMTEADRQGATVFTSRADGVLSGAAVLPDIAAARDGSLQIELLLADGSKLHRGSQIARMTGPMRSILAVERTALNFLTHLSGIASLTAIFAQQAQGTRAAICDTRKTIPGLRGLAKYAVVCGGGTSHRMGLYDAVLIKDNHIAHLSIDQLRDQLMALVPRVRRDEPQLAFIEIEVDTPEQCKAILALPPEAQPDIILLDNMSCNTMGQIVTRRDATAPEIQLEASGGVTLETVKAIARTGVDRISIGALTHSAPALDVGLDAE
jgi:nicotinate-nucleotide pyrophosphorylase (carboxylating)